MLWLIHYCNVLRARWFKLLCGRAFGRYGRGTWIIAPVAIRGAENIRLGDDVFVAAGGYLAAESIGQGKEVLLEIGDGCRIGNANHIFATERVTIEAKVLTASGVYISDNGHEYRDPSVPVMDQAVRQLRPVRIGAGSWLGEHACVVGASLGRNCVVGAHAVVLHDVPDFSVVVGAPARVIRRYDQERAEWRATCSNGDFI